MMMEMPGEQMMMVHQQAAAQNNTNALQPNQRPWQPPNQQQAHWGRRRRRHSGSRRRRLSRPGSRRRRRSSPGSCRRLRRGSSRRPGSRRRRRALRPRSARSGPMESQSQSSSSTRPTVARRPSSSFPGGAADWSVRVEGQIERCTTCVLVVVFGVCRHGKREYTRTRQQRTVRGTKQHMHLHPPFSSDLSVDQAILQVTWWRPTCRRCRRQQRVAPLRVDEFLDEIIDPL